MLLEGLDAALTELVEVDAAGVDDSSLTAVMVELNRMQAKLDALRAQLTAEWNQRRLWAASGARNAAAWLTATCRTQPETANRHVRHAKHLATLPETSAALARGEITSDHVARLVSVDTARTADALRRDEAELVGYAKASPWPLFCRQVAYWLHEADPDGAQPPYERRRVYLSRTIDDCWALDGWLDQVTGTIIHDELSRLEHRLFAADWSNAKTRLERDPLPHELARTPAQRRADALLEMAKRSATMPKNGRRPRPLITIAVGAGTFTRMCETRGGTAIHPAAAAALLDDAIIERIVFGEEGRVITASRQRTFTGALRRAIDLRDRECYHAYCSEPADRCQADHIVPWTHGGATSFENAQLACPFHNRARSHAPP